MVVGAGRGPLVNKTLICAMKLNKFVSVYAVEKNKTAVAFLEDRRNHSWGGENGLSCGRVQIINMDMRQWSGPDGEADLVVSELLGSFGDNELSPECLDGVWRYSSRRTICIPCEYTSYICPVQSQKLHSHVFSLDSASSTLGNVYTVDIHNAYIIDDPKPVFTFKHHNLELPPQERNNNRSSLLTFQPKLDCVCHGFVGFFDCRLFGDITLSTVPSKRTKDLVGWFPVYFTISKPVPLDMKNSIKLHMTRNVGDDYVWYEWTILEPFLTRTHNLKGVCYAIGQSTDESL